MRLCCARYRLTLEQLKQVPRTLAIVNTNTPLQLDKTMTETLFTMLKYRQPVIITAAAMAGTTAPVTLAGTLAVANAEILATIVLAQMYAPEAPVIYGSQSSNADMASCAMAIGSPEGALCYQYCAELAHFYGLPCRTGGCLTDARAVDAQAGYESMLTYLACRQSRADLIFQAAGIVSGYLAVSYEKLIVDFEIIDIVNRYLKGIVVSEDEIPETLIHDVGQGGNFLTEGHTLRHCRSAAMIPNISIRGNDQTADALTKNIYKRMQKLLSKYKLPEIPAYIEEDMRKVLRTCGVDEQMIHQLDQF